MMTHFKKNITPYFVAIFALLIFVCLGLEFNHNEWWGFICSLLFYPLFLFLVEMNADHDIGDYKWYKKVYYSLEHRDLISSDPDRYDEIVYNTYKGSCIDMKKAEILGCVISATGLVAFFFIIAITRP